MEVFAPAKVNLALLVLGKRPDGFHDLWTVVQKVDLADRLTIEVTPPGHNTADPEGAIAFTCSRPDLAGPDNLVVRAARLLRERTGTRQGARIHLEKRIPAGAGLGGGSSDAAATLAALDRLWGTGLGLGRLAGLGAELGSDVPLFLHPSPSLVTGRGEVVEPCSWRLDAWYVIVFPGFPISTAWAYRNFRLTSNGGKDRISRLLAVDKGGISPDIWGEILVNDLEEGVLPSHPVLAGLKERLRKSGARASLMSGSGSSVFGLFDDALKAKEAAGEFSSRGEWAVFLARPVYGGPLAPIPGAGEDSLPVA